MKKQQVKANKSKASQQPSHAERRRQATARQERPGQEEQRRRAAARREREAAGFKRFIIPGLWAAFGLLVIGLIAYQAWSSRGAPANSAYPAVDGITCDSGEHANYHIHANLTIYINGKQVNLPAGIGIASDNSCIYWLHTHNTDGMIHIEAPGGSKFTLKNFLDIWSRYFEQVGYPNELNQTTGWQVSVDGKSFTDDLHTIPLQNHTIITLAYNSPNIQPNTNINWNGL